MLLAWLCLLRPFSLDLEREKGVQGSLEGWMSNWMLPLMPSLKALAPLPSTHEGEIVSPEILKPIERCCCSDQRRNTASCLDCRKVTSIPKLGVIHVCAVQPSKK